MQKNMFMKGLVLGIMILFIGAGVISSTGSIEKEHNDGFLSKSDDRWNPDWLYYIGGIYGSGPPNYLGGVQEIATYGELSFGIFT